MLSNNNNIPELFLAKDQDQDDDQTPGEESCVSEEQKPISRIASLSPEEPAEAHLGCHHDVNVDDEQSILQEEEQERVVLLIKTGTRTTPSHCDILEKPSLAQGLFQGHKEEEEEEEEEEGCRTPTSAEHKIPECKICPSAPRKRKSSELNKRKVSSSNNPRTILVFDELDDIESLFTVVKKSRRGGTTRSA